MAEIQVPQTCAPNDLYWAAGFLEGEGAFMYCGGSPIINAPQVQREPLERLERIIGGVIFLRDLSKRRPCQDIYVWRVTGYNAAMWMRELRGLMSPRRQGQIDAALTQWDQRPRLKGRWWAWEGKCFRGHDVTAPGALYVRHDGERFCRECGKINRRDYYARLKARGIKPKRSPANGGIPAISRVGV